MSTGVYYFLRACCVFITGNFVTFGAPFNIQFTWELIVLQCWARSNWAQQPRDPRGFRPRWNNERYRQGSGVIKYIVGVFLTRSMVPCRDKYRKGRGQSYSSGVHALVYIKIRPEVEATLVLEYLPPSADPDYNWKVLRKLQCIVLPSSVPCCNNRQPAERLGALYLSLSNSTCNRPTEYQLHT